MRSQLARILIDIGRNLEAEGVAHRAIGVEESLSCRLLSVVSSSGSSLFFVVVGGDNIINIFYYYY